MFLRNNIKIWKDSSGWYIAKMVGYDIQVQGPTISKAIDRLNFLIRAYKVVGRELEKDLLKSLREN